VMFVPPIESRADVGAVGVAAQATAKTQRPTAAHFIFEFLHSL
jgi:hypothetical protein